MKCSDIREALSAMADGESTPFAPASVRAHVLGCEVCAAYQRSLALLESETARLRAETAVVPDIAARVTAPQSRPRARALLALRWAIAVAALAELVTALALTWSAEAAGREAHESHECVSMTAALCVGLLCVALKPRLAAGYLPVLGISSVLLVLTSVVDVSDHEVTVPHELSHAGLVVGFLLVAVLAWGDHVGPWPWQRIRSRSTRRVVRPARLRLLHRSGGPAARRWPRVLAALGLASALVLIAGPASAHAVLEGSTPAANAVLRTPPTQVVLHFDENVSLLPTSVRVFAPDGSRADNGIVGHAQGDGTTASVGLDAPRRGTYLVSWRVISADSHPVSGAYTFSVGAPSAAPTATTLHNVPSVAGLLGIARWIGYAGSSLLLGGLAFGLLCRPRREPLVRRLMLGGAAGLALGAAIGLLAQGALDAGLGLSALGRPSLVREVLGTTYGRATLARLVLAALGAAAVLFVRGLWAQMLATILLAVGIGVSFAAAGHAVAGSHRDLTMVVDCIHVIGASVWLGGLVMLVVTLRPRGGVGDVIDVTRRFSRVAMTCVVALVATGTYQAWRQVGSWGAFSATTYGRELLIKILVVAAAIALAAGSRWWLWRALRPPVVVEAATASAAPPQPSSSAAPVGQLRRTVASEMALGALVLGITSALVATEPAATAYRPVVSANLTIEGDLVQVSAIPAAERAMDLHLYVFGPDQQPTNPKQITATVSLPSQQIGPLPVRLYQGGPGHWAAAVTVPVAGDWQLAVTVRTTAIDESTQYLDMPIR